MTAAFELDRLGFGSAPIGGLYAPLPEADAIDTILIAYEQGIRFFDTAPKYGNGLSEERIGLALRGIPRTNYRLSSKAGWDIFTDGRDPQPAFTREGIRRSVESSLKRLQTDFLDIVHLHDPDAHFEIALREAYPALIELRNEGLIGAVGVGMNQWQMLAHFLDKAVFDGFMLAGRYTLIEQGASPLLDRCAHKGVSVYLGGVFNSGILATGNVSDARYNYVSAPAHVRQRVEQIAAICAAHEVSLPAAAIHFGLLHPAVALVVIGMRTPDEVNANIRAFLSHVPTALWSDLSAAGLISMDAPTAVIPENNLSSYDRSF
jgi:D-threo-aldose 1-dehydrogenase